MTWFSRKYSTTEHVKPISICAFPKLIFSCPLPRKIASNVGAFYLSAQVLFAAKWQEMLPWSGLMILGSESSPENPLLLGRKHGQDTITPEMWTRKSWSQPSKKKIRRSFIQLLHYSIIFIHTFSFESGVQGSIIPNSDQLIILLILRHHHIGRLFVQQSTAEWGAVRWSRAPVPLPRMPRKKCRQNWLAQFFPGTYGGVATRRGSGQGGGNKLTPSVYTSPALWKPNHLFHFQKKWI